MSDLQLDFAALEGCLQNLQHLFIDIHRLKVEPEYEEKRGGYGDVQVSILDSGTPASKLVAAKTIRLRARHKEPRRLAFRLARELTVWAGLQHPHILPLLGYYLDTDYKIAVLISEYMINGDLKDYMEQENPPWGLRLHLIRDSTDGLAYLHGQNPPICHGDLKTGNVLVTSERRAMLADFGLSKALVEGVTGLTTSDGLKGTLRYYSPELFKGTEPGRRLPSDIWAWACLKLEVLADRIPYAEKNAEPAIVLALMNDEPPSDVDALPIPIQSLKQLLTECWNFEPSKRPSATDCLHILNMAVASWPMNAHIDSERTEVQDDSPQQDLQYGSTNIPINSIESGAPSQSNANVDSKPSVQENDADHGNSSENNQHLLNISVPDSQDPGQPAMEETRPEYKGDSAANAIDMWSHSVYRATVDDRVPPPPLLSPGLAPASGLYPLGLESQPSRLGPEHVRRTSFGHTVPRPRVMVNERLVPGQSNLVKNPTGVSIASNVKAVGVKRHAFGKRGSPIILDVNCFETKIPERFIYHYTVEFIPQSESKPLKMELFRKVQELPEFLQVSQGKKGVYNSDNQFFSTVSLGDACQFQLQDCRKTYTTRLTQVATINAQVLLEYVQGDRDREDHVSTVLSACNVAVRMGLLEKYPLYDRTSFFVRDAGFRGFKDRKYDGLEMWRGFFQSFRPVMGKVIINIDVSTGVIVKGGPLIVMALQFLRQPPNNVQYLANLGPNERQALKRFLRGVKFVTNDAPDARPSAIKSLTKESAEAYNFKTDDGKSISIAQYNQKKGTPLRYPQLPCIEIIGQSRAVYPMEHCIVRPQLLPKQVEPDQINDLLNFSTMKPHLRLQKIREGFQFLEYGQNEYLRDFGISIDPNPLRLQARVLPPPELQYSGNKFERPHGGTWRTGKFFMAKEVKGWIVIDLSGYPNLPVQQIVMDIKRSCVTQGMRWTNNNPISIARNPMTDPEVAIREALAKHKKKGIDATLVMIIIPDEGKDLYNKIKHIGDVKLGIATQCLKASKCAKGGRNYSTNVSLKINAKLGGTNFVLKASDAKFLVDQPVLILGADVMHSRAMGDEGLGRPSFAAVTGNIDVTGCRYVSAGRAQQTRQEMIQDLEGIVGQIIIEYKKANPGKKPFTSVIYFRDGVAENQFKTVIEEELPQIRNACKKAGIKTGIKLTCVIVGKRHHVRIFPVDQSGADRTGNALPGTVIDSVITSPVEFDFYLQPHAGLLGTSRPVHCNVLIDDNMFTPDDLQQLTFNLCHVYARSTRSVSLPAPVYYAHLVCARANHRYDPKGNFSLDAPAPRSMRKEDAERRLQEFINAFMPLHPNTQSVMYFQ